MLCIHVCGTMCAGKTSLIDDFLAKTGIPRSVYWDVKENFYIPNKLLTDKGMDFDKYRDLEREGKLERSLLEHVHVNCQQGFSIIESSGINEHINRLLEVYLPETMKLYLQVPLDLAKRAKQRDEDFQYVLNFADKYRKKAPDVWFVSQTEALKAMLLAVRRHNVPKNFDYLDIESILRM